MSEESPPPLPRQTVFKTKLPPCSLRINPRDNQFIYLGTYKLIKDSDRYGSIEVYKHDNLTNSITKITEHKTDGAILDLKIDPFDDSKLCCVLSTGNLSVWKIDETDYSILTKLVDLQIYETTTLITAVNYHKLVPNMITLSTTTGQCSVIRLNPQDLSIDEQIDFDYIHDLECWYSEFGSQPNLENVVFSGGDDRKLIANDMRAPMYSNVFVTDRIHDAGIVSILASSDNWCPSNPYALWTGSYDDHVKSLDLRVVPPMELITGMPPRVKQSVSLGGGVWKLIPDPKSTTRLLSCCMYDGARLLETDEQGNDIRVENYFKGDHESMCYGGDWVNDKIVTCSFYDNVVQIWKP